MYKINKIIILFLIFSTILNLNTYSESKLFNSVYGQEYQGVDRIISGVAAEFFEDKSGFDIEYTLEGVLTKFEVKPDDNTIIFYYDSKGIKEDVLIIKLPEELIDRPRVVYVDDQLEPEAIVSKIGNSTTVYVPLFENSNKITFVGSQIISKETGKGGGCLIATATYGSEFTPQVQQLRELRDNKLLHTESGSAFMNTFNSFYYTFSPKIADYERENPIFKEMIKFTITPLISSLSILNYLDMDSESKVLGYGISLIILNIGMYFGIPAIVINEVKKRANRFQVRKYEK